MENNTVVIDNNQYTLISDVFVEDSHYYLASQLDNNLVSTDNYVFLLTAPEDENNTYKIVEDDEIKSILAKIFLSIIDKM